jgi:hypothetical protein
MCDVSVILRVTNIMLPSTVQSGAHEDYPPTKVSRYVGPKEGILTNKARIRRNKESLDVEFFVS